MEYKLQTIHFQHNNLPKIRQDSVSKLRDLHNKWRLALIVSTVVVVIVTTVTIYFHLHRTEENITLESQQTTKTSVSSERFITKSEFTNFETKTLTLKSTVTTKAAIGRQMINPPENTEEHQVSKDIDSNIAGHSGNVHV